MSVEVGLLLLLLAPIPLMAYAPRRAKAASGIGGMSAFGAAATTVVLAPWVLIAVLHWALRCDDTCRSGAGWTNDSGAWQWTAELSAALSAAGAIALVVRFY